MSRYDTLLFPTYFFAEFALPRLVKYRQPPRLTAEAALGCWFVHVVRDEGEIPEKYQYVSLREALKELTKLIKAWYEGGPLPVAGVGWKELMGCPTFEALEEILYDRYPCTSDLCTLARCLWNIRQAYLEEVEFLPEASSGDEEV